METDARIYIAGHTGLVGSAITRELQAQNYPNLITRTHAELDLTDATALEHFWESVQPTHVFLAAAKVGGIGANSALPADFFYENITISFNIISTAQRHNTTRLINLGSSCIYPKHAPQPIPESALLTGPLEPTNDSYALAKIAALKYCIACNRQYGSDFYSLMPTNLYGTGDHYDLSSSHVLPALIARFHQAKLAAAPGVILWGDGTPLREFLYADDLARAAVHLMQHHNAQDVGDWINVGSGQELTIAALAKFIRDIIYADTPTQAPAITYDPTHPGGTPRKLLDSTRIHTLGWHPTTDLKTGIQAAYADYLTRNPT